GAGSKSPFNPPRVLLANLVDQRAEIRDAAMRKSEIRIELDRLLEHLQAIIYILAACVASSAQVKIVRQRIFRGLARHGFFFLRRKSDTQSLGDAPGDFFLDGKYVLQLPVVALGPDGMSCRGFH